MANKATKMRPTAWACRTCQTLIWDDGDHSVGFPKHVSHRGFEIGTCEGRLIPLYKKEAKDGEESRSGL